jgi:PRTRC genetic system ThiF family protein
MEIDTGYLHALRLLVPEYTEITLCLVGCGGTGSWLAPALVRIVKMVSQNLPRASLLFIDPDSVEEKNIFRQNFCLAEIGRGKAESLALRYSGAWGVDISHLRNRFEKSFWMNHTGWGELVVIIGCVDNAKARREFATAFGESNRSDTWWWLDCGNEKNYGQVLLGGGDQDKPFKLAGTCSALPLPSLQHPELIEERIREETKALSCAEMQQEESQGLSINQRMAAEAADYLVRMLVTKDLKKYATYLDLESGTTRSKYISNALFEPGKKVEERHVTHFYE